MVETPAGDAGDVLDLRDARRRVPLADEIGKGYEIAKDQTVPVTDEELEQMPLPTAKAIEIAAFVDADTIDPVRISDSYYLAADGQVAAKEPRELRSLQLQEPLSFFRRDCG